MLQTTSKIKVLYILHSASMGGATISFLNMLRGVEARGMATVVVVPGVNEEFCCAVEDIGAKWVKSTIVKTVYIPSGENKLKKICDLVKLALLKAYSFVRILGLTLREKPDIIHTNTGVVHEGWLVARLLRKPHVWHLREYQDLDFGMRILPSKKSFSWELEHSFVISITKDILRYFDVAEDDKHRVIYNGILPKDEVAMGFPKEKFFLCCSRVSPEKGHGDVIRSFALFHRQHPDYRLVILGKGSDEYTGLLVHLADELGCSEAIDFVGYQKDVIPYMRKAMALVVASYNEGFGRMTAEAAFCGCLVIGRNTGGTKEILNKTGGFPFLTNEEMLRSMERIADMTKEEYRKMASAAQQVAVEMYCNERNVESIYQFYQSILANENMKPS